MEKTPRNERCAPRIASAAVAYTEITHIVVIFGIVAARAVGLAVKIVFGAAFLIAELGKRNRKHVVTAVTGKNDV